MANPEQIAWLASAKESAVAANHIFAEMAACEAALESNWGASQLARLAHNLFGEKQHVNPIFATLDLPTREYSKATGQWIWIPAQWVKFPTLTDCFTERMTRLRELAGTYPDYALALAAEDPIEYVTEVSKTWSTDPERAAKCIQIYNAHKDVLSKDGQTDKVQPRSR